jgi:hypothetical protein
MQCGWVYTIKSMKAKKRKSGVDWADDAGCAEELV